eukprot:NODE_4463_length_804_cov_43.442384_g4129_i0.p1 GENE.NODE_4463_length_804_cov_43.442384_g4129_i0~~NODE_4463_length_804_cov_43.442384_g4129_i0.p1  ORF type:complete len:207 (-),score=62.59 NODE_4463_length_804_cov_43.442384_g4129_i0:183-731(-)
MTLTPAAKWAQRAEHIFLTLDVCDAKDVKIDFTEKTVQVAMTGQGARAGSFAHTFNLNQEIVPGESKFDVRAREVALNLKKKESGFWDRLTEEPTKATKQFLTVDWDLWKDEDEDDGSMPGGMDFGGMGGMGGMDFGGMGGMDGMDFGGDGGDSDDDEDAPPLEDLDGPPEGEPTASSSSKE